MNLLMHISDTHFGTERPPVVEALVALVHRLAPSLIVLSGDITQRSRRSQFRSARVFMERLGSMPVIAIPGNHDIALFDLAARLFWPYRNYRRYLHQELEPEFESDSLLVAAVNTTRRYRHIDGEISDEQIERVARRLQVTRPDKLRIVVTHQPVCVTEPYDLHNLLHGHDQAVRRWTDAGADLILGGHIHLPFVCPLHERMGLPRPLWAVQAGTALSSRIRYGTNNSVNLIRYRSGPDGKHCVVERWDYRPDLRHFSLVTHQDLSLSAHDG